MWDHIRAPHYCHMETFKNAYCHTVIVPLWESPLVSLASIAKPSPGLSRHPPLMGRCWHWPHCRPLLTCLLCGRSKSWALYGSSLDYFKTLTPIITVFYVRVFWEPPPRWPSGRRSEWTKVASLNPLLLDECLQLPLQESSQVSHHIC